MIKLTPGRLRWLQKLRDEGPQKRGRGSQARACMDAGLAALKEKEAS